MSDCERVTRCPFFIGKLEAQPGVVAVLKRKYCLSGKKQDCARYRVVAEGIPAPEDLFPNQGERVNRIIETHSLLGQAPADGVTLIVRPPAADTR